MNQIMLYCTFAPGPWVTRTAHLTWMDAVMHDMGSLGHMLPMDLPRDWMNLTLDWDVWRGVRCGQPC